MSHQAAEPVALPAADLRRLAGRFAAGLETAGVRAGDRVVVSLPNSVELLAAVWACVASGRIPVPLDPRLTPHEREPILDDVSPALVLDSLVRFAELLEPEPVDLDPDPRCRPMHFTSGTTGRPKGVWSGFWDVTDAEQAVLEERDLWGFAAEDVNLVVSPLYHSAPLRFALGTALAGGDVAVLPTFTPEGFCEAVARLRPTTMFCVPAHLQRLLAHLEVGATIDVSSFRLVAHAGAPCPDPIRRGAHALFGTDVVWEFYGSTEGQFTACSAPEWAEHPGTVGRARPGRTITVDHEDELWCAVPPWGRFAYWNDEERTANAWRDTADGPAFTVGDLGRVDDDGYVYLDSRRTDLIISGGVNVYPAEVEAALVEVPGVVEIAVFGRPDEHWGQRVVAAHVGDASEDALREAATERLAPPKRPKEYERVEALPRTATGKVRRTEL
ncbi:acyl--CoA ligase [Aeromicrobium tamlense]|uniref:Acyl--CoA ligase n=1 Tax=Aeromicrobium tamlense TaxID=375541 RepID=A0A8I0G0Z5_9ACTN|nr:class I adenylate-forming enzyme family protein [Aeromicrobium tamlense]MBD1270934.1 acyl--CoA ligase [Aeromicrobium tamlense]NYI38325.1 long-chain acyl-CoA synthetase [Aeromicrobium tamlense]